MRLPNCESAFVEDAKLRYYLDESRRGDPGSKVGLFRDILGFTRLADLRGALLSHAVHGAAVACVETPWGLIWNIDGPLKGPLRTIPMRTAWIVESDSRSPRNITAFPLPDERALGSQHGH
jgi:hypothetical protein